MRVRQRVARVHLQEMILVFVQLCSSNVDMISTGTVRRAVPLREMKPLVTGIHATLCQRGTSYGFVSVSVCHKLVFYRNV